MIVSPIQYFPYEFRPAAPLSLTPNSLSALPRIFKLSDCNLAPKIGFVWLCFFAASDH